MRTRTRVLLLLGFIAFLLVNVAGALWAMREREILHTFIHVVLALGAAYLLPHVLRRPDRSRESVS